MPTLTLLSNGHGEDAVGALLAAEVLRQRPDLSVRAFPTVGVGKAYEGVVPVLGPRQGLPSGGLLVHDPRLLVQDLKAGFLGMTLRQLRELRGLSTDVLIVVGDVYALLLSSLVPTRSRFYLQTLVSSHHAGPTLASLTRPHRYFMENISYPERALMRRLARRVYVRDAATARQLQAQGLKHVKALGNPVLDATQGQPMSEHTEQLCVALLPGTRGYAAASLATMLHTLTYLPDVTGLVAWAGGALPAPPNWERDAVPDTRGLRAVWRRGQQRVYVYENRFADVLHTARAVLGTSGTAHEQAAALGKPVVSFAVAPLYSPAFLENQRRLLGEALTLVEPEPVQLAAALPKLLNDEARLARVAELGPKRLGGPGGTRAIVQDVLAHATLQSCV